MKLLVYAFYLRHVQLDKTPETTAYFALTFLVLYRLRSLDICFIVSCSTKSSLWVSSSSSTAACPAPPLLGLSSIAESWAAFSATT
mmetsp:Transcript_138/g.281  ORF Transcript_138/g.281 Transcript_138/m.281 type:complete len:86 (+) Transcript_138:44-301(+)